MIHATGLIFMLSCTGQIAEKKNSEKNEDIVLLTDAQIAGASIETEKIEKRSFHDTTIINGVVISAPNDKILVSAPVKAYLKRIIISDGDMVRKGQTLAVLEHSGIIKLKQDYITAKSEYTFRRTDLERQGELSLEHATSLKKQQQAQNEFQKAEAIYLAMKSRLRLIGINADSLSADNIGPDYSLKAPLSGRLSFVQAENGLLCNESTPLFVIDQGTGSYLKLKINTDSGLLFHYGQSVPFTTADSGNFAYKAILTSVNQSSDKSAFFIRAKIQSPPSSLKSGIPVKAYSINKVMAFAIPSKCIFTQNSGNYIFIQLSSDQFRAVKIVLGKTENGWTVIKSENENLENKWVVTHGIGFLIDQLDKK